MFRWHTSGCDGWRPDRDLRHSIYKNGQLEGAATGFPWLWLDDSHLIVARLTKILTGFRLNALSEVYDPSGTLVGPFPNTGITNRPLQVVTPSSVLTSDGAIRNVSTGVEERSPPSGARADTRRSGAIRHRRRGIATFTPIRA
ncbi:MAG: hypothetical protein QM756_18880 [Polyangiaceae bacterium]